MARRGRLISILTWFFMVNTFYIFYLDDSTYNVIKVTDLPILEQTVTDAHSNPKQVALQEMTKQNYFMEGALVQTWKDMYGASISSFINHPLYPNYFNDFEVVKNPTQFHCADTNSARRISGYLQPLKTAQYKFLIESDDNSEFWLSENSRSIDLKLLCQFGVTFEKSTKNSLKNIRSISKTILLSEGQKYYYNILHKQSFGACYMKLLWRKDNETIFEEIGKELFWFKDKGLHNDIDPLNFERQNNGIITIKNTRQCLDNLNICNEGVDVTYQNTTGRYERVISLESNIGMLIYPDDKTQKLTYICDEMKADSFCLGNSVISSNEIANVQADVTKNTLGKASSENDCSLEVNEATKYTSFDGNQYYYLDINVTENEAVYRTPVEYTKPLSGIGTVCLPRWNPNSFNTRTIHVVITVYNQGLWLEYFLHSIQRIFEKNPDENIHIIIADFSSTDVNIDTLVARYPAVPITVFVMQNGFEKVLGIKKAVDSVESSNDIIFLMDLHIEFPDNIFELARKHCRKRFSIFSPIVMRLAPGHTKVNPAGYWELMGHGIFAMYKHDWKRIQGLENIHGNRKWGGEDWLLLKEIIQNGLEIKRIRLSGFFHYYHSHDQLWDKSKDVDKYNRWSIGSL